MKKKTEKDEIRNHIELFCRKRKWRELPTKRKNVKVYQKMIGLRLFQVDLPMSKDFRDYDAAIQRALDEIREYAKCE